MSQADVLAHALKQAIGCWDGINDRARYLLTLAVRGLCKELRDAK